MNLIKGLEIKRKVSILGEEESGNQGSLDLAVPKSQSMY